MIVILCFKPRRKALYIFGKNYIVFPKKVYSFFRKSIYFYFRLYGGLLLFIPQRYNTTIKEVGQHEKAVVQLDSRPLKIKKIN
nr:MAG TPA: hypothetical protein [Caudoviricetes sp.]